MDDRAAVDDVADAGTAYEGDLSNRIEALRLQINTERDERIRDVRVLNDHAQQEVQDKDDMYRTIQGLRGDVKQEHEANNSMHRSIEGLRVDSERNYTFSTTTSNQLRQLRAEFDSERTRNRNIILQLQQQNQQLQATVAQLTQRIVALEPSDQPPPNRYSWRSVYPPAEAAVSRVSIVDQVFKDR